MSEDTLFSHAKTCYERILRCFLQILLSTKKSTVSSSVCNQRLFECIAKRQNVAPSFDASLAAFQYFLRFRSIVPTINCMQLLVQLLTYCLGYSMTTLSLPLKARPCDVPSLVLMYPRLRQEQHHAAALEIYHQLMQSWLRNHPTWSKSSEKSLKVNIFLLFFRKKKSRIPI